MENKTLAEIKKHLEDTMSEWSGEEPGTKEDKAHLAEDALDTLKSLEAMLASLEF